MSAREPRARVSVPGEVAASDSGGSRSVLLIGNFLFASGGAWGVCESLAVQLERRGWNVITASSHRARWKRLIDMVRTTWRRRLEYEVAHVDVYSGQSFLWAEAVCWALRRAAKPYVLTLHGGNLPSFGRRWPARVRRLLRGARAVTTPSGYLHAEMKRYRPDLQVLPNGVEFADHRFRLRSDPQPHLIWVRAFHRIYNPSLAIRVVAMLKSAYSGIRLSMLGPDRGDGTLEEARRLARELGVEECVSWVGQVPKSEVPEWLSRHDVFLNTTDVDNTPVSMLEAMAGGLLVVSTDAGGVPYLVRDGENGLLVPRDDAEALAAAVRRALAEPGLAERLSGGARDSVQGFDWDAIAPRWENLLMTAGRSA